MSDSLSVEELPGSVSWRSESSQSEFVSHNHVPALWSARFTLASKHSVVGGRSSNFTDVDRDLIFLHLRAIQASVMFIIGEVLP